MKSTIILYKKHKNKNQLAINMVRTCLAMIKRGNMFENISWANSGYHCLIKEITEKQFEDISVVNTNVFKNKLLYKLSDDDRILFSKPEDKEKLNTLLTLSGI
jgi:hypothetical protein